MPFKIRSYIVKMLIFEDKMALIPFVKKKLYCLSSVLFICTAEAKFDLSTAYSYYLTPTSSEGQLNHYVDVGLNFTHYKSLENWFYGAEAYSLFSLDSSHQNYMGVPSLYIAYGTDRIVDGYKFNFIFGRQKISLKEDIKKNSTQISTGPWSFMDEIWSLGLWQPRARWDYLKSEQQGLMGSFVTVAKKRWLFTLFLSGIFFPEQGPSVDITKGDINSGSRWFIPPQSKFIIFSQRIDAFYWLQEPYLKDVILNDSVAVRFRFGEEDTQWLSVAYAYKPVNQLYFKVDGHFSINKKSVESFIHYQSFKHSLVSIDFGLKYKIFKTVLSITQEIPHSPDVPKDWIAPDLPKALFFSSHFKLDLKQTSGLLEFLQFNFLHSKFVSFQDTASLQNNQLKLDLSANRFKLHSGFSVATRTKSFQLGSQAISTGLSYWYSIPEKGGWLQASLRWKITSRLAILTEVDIMGVNNTMEESFFNSYKHNDRVVTKLTYNIGT